MRTNDDAGPGVGGLAGDDATREGEVAGGEPGTPASGDHDAASLLSDLSTMGQVRARLTLDRVFAVAKAGVEYVEWMRVLGFAPEYPGTPWAKLCRAADRLKTLREIRRAERGS